MSLAATRDPLIGRTLGDFVVREKIGEGGFGAVYRSEQPLLEREAVIKVLHRQQLESEASVKRFLLEARVASRLDHPYAAHIYAFGVERDGLLWIAMELVRGTPLSHLLDAGGPLPLDRFVPLLERICEVVHSAHEKGIVHRDIKPGNVMVLTRSGRFLPKLLDFGIAKLLAHPGAVAAQPRIPTGSGPAAGDALPTAATMQVAVELPSGERDTIVGNTPSTGSRPTPTTGLTEEGAVMGSPHYMAPEQWRDLASADARTDIYALGVLAYEALTGLPPFRGRTRVELARAHANEPVPPVGEGLPAALDAVLARAMAKEPDDRFASALELAAAVRIASGLIEVAVEMPSLEDEVREAALAAAPQPIAEAVAALAAARTPHEAQGAVRDCQHVVARMLGLVALACRSRAGAGVGSTTARDAPEVLDALRALRRRDLDDEEWRDLTRDLCRPFAAAPDAHPMPEMVRLFTGDPEDFSLVLPAAAPRAMNSEQAHAELKRSLPRLARLLRAVAFLDRYPLVVWRDNRAESWMGLRRARRPAIRAGGEPLPVDRPALIDRDGRPVVMLWPLFQVGRPSPGAAEEMFLFVGKDRRGARFVALPGELERHDESLWEWFGLHLIDSIEDTTGGAAAETAPYRGLLPFTAEHAADYVGREGEVDAFLNRLRVQPLLAVVAPSGVGKSSFVQAGVVPAIGETWQAMIVRPGPAPRAALAALFERSGVPVASDEELGAALRAHAARGGRPVLLVIDQFEELFTLCLDPAERIAFAELIASLARSADDPVRVVLTLRDDFLVRADELPALRERLAVGIQLLSMPSQADLIRILTTPARRHGYDFEDQELPADMVDAVAGRPGALALLSFTAARLWELRDRHFKQLGRKAYDALGGVAGALAQHAEATLAEMAADEQRLVREAFRHLVTAEGTRAVLTRPELQELLGGGGRAERVIERLIGSRLLVASESGAAGEQSIEVVHEALLSGWPRLVEWRREDAEGARMRDQLRAAARQWEERGRPRGLLWRDEAWAEYEIWRVRYLGARTELEDAFAAASAAEAARGRRIRRALVLAAFAALAAFALFFAWANRETGRARELAEDKAREVRGLLIDSYIEQGRGALLGGAHARALAYLVEARRMGADSPSLSFLIRRAMRPLEPRVFTLGGHAGKVWDLRFNPDGRTLVTTDDRDVRLWDANSGRELVRMRGHTDAVYTAAISPDGSRLASGGADSTIRLWDAHSGRSLATLRGHQGRIEALGWTPDGAVLLSAGQDGAHLWDPAGGRELAHVTGDPAGERVAAIDPAGRYAAVGGSSGQVDIIDMAERRVVTTRQLGAAVTSLDFDRQARLVTAGWSGVAQLWQVPDGRLLFTLVGHGDKVDGAEFSRDGRWIVTAGRDGTARVWNAATGAMEAVLRGHRGPVFRARFDPSAEHIVTAGDDAAALWERSGGRRSALFEGHAAAVSDARFAPDGSRVATFSWDGTAVVWSVDDAYLEARSPRPGGACPFSGGSARESRYLVAPCAEGTAIWDIEANRPIAELPGAELAEASGDGQRAITASGSSATLWDLAARRPLGRLDHRGTITAVDWSPTAHAALSAGEDGAAHLWREGEATRELGRDGSEPVTAAAFTPDGRTVLVGHRGGSLGLFDAASGAPIARLEVGASVEGLRFSHEGGLVVVLPPIGSAMPSLWDLAGRTRIGDLAGNVGASLDAGFDRDDERLVVASGDGVVRVYSARTAAQLGELTGSAQFSASAAFTPSGQLVAATGGDGVIRFWDAASLDLLWELHAHAVAGVELRFASDSRLVSRDWEGTVHVWQLDGRPLGVAELDEFLRCRSPVRFDPSRRSLVATSPDRLCR